MPLEDLEKELYGQKKPKLKIKVIKKEEKSSEKHAPADSVLIEEEISEEPRFISGIQKFSRGLLIFLIIGIVILGGVVGFLIWRSPNTEKISVEISGPKEIMLGVPFELKINLANNSESLLNLGKLALNLPEGVAELGHTPEEETVINRYVGDIDKSEYSEQTFSLVALSGEQTTKEFKATFSYTTPGLVAGFEHTTKFEINVTEPALFTDISVPQKILSGEIFETEIKYQNLSDITFNDLELDLTYPPNFEYKDSDIKPASGTNNIWKIDKLSPQESGSFNFKGSIIGKADSFFEIASDLKAPFAGRYLSVNKKSASIAIAPSPLLLEMTVNNQNEYTAHPQDALTYNIKYQNNSGVGLQDVILKVQLIGAMFDFSSLRSNSFFSSVDNTLTWNAAMEPKFKMLAPGDSGAVQFSISLKDSYPIKRLSDKNYILKANAEMESPTVPYFVSADKTVALANLETKVAGQITADALAFYQDSAFGISNSGPFPPKVNTPTTYTVHWQVKTFASDFKDIELRAFLLSGVNWTGKVKSNVSGSLPEFNERTSEVIWKIDRIIANQGTVGKPVEAVFQISATPSVNQLDQYMPLLSETKLSASDEFAGLKINISDRALDTGLPDDPTAKDGRVKM